MKREVSGSTLIDVANTETLNNRQRVIANLIIFRTTLNYCDPIILSNKITSPQTGDINRVKLIIPFFLKINQKL